MKFAKRIFATLLAVTVIATCFAGCSSKINDKYADDKLIIAYTDSVAPFLEVNENGDATGFMADLFAAIFDDVKGDLKSYTFEKVEEGYTLEEDGGFFNEEGSSNKKEYSAGLMMGAVAKNEGTFNEDYSYTEPIITNRVVAVVPNNKENVIKSYKDFAGASVYVVGDVAEKAFDNHAQIKNSAKSVTKVDSFETATKDFGKENNSVVIIDEFTFYKNGIDAVKDYYAVLDGELETIEYVIACAKNSGWMWSLNEAIREAKSADYGDGDTFTPLVEKYFGYNASSFTYETDGDK